MHLSKRRVPFRGLLAAVLAVAVPIPGTAVAQGRDRDIAAAFRDSIAGARPDQLRVLEQALLAKARRDRSNPVLHLRLGLVALTLGEWSDAVSEFKWSGQLAPQWGAAWLGLAEAELALGEVADTSRLGRRAFLAKDAWERAATAFGRAVGADPGQAAFAEAVARNRIDRGLPASAEVVRDGLRRAVGARTRTAAAALSLARVELMVGDTAAALVAQESAAAMPGGRGTGLLEAARLRLARGDVRGVQLFYDAAAVNDPGPVAAIRSDIAWVATPAELGAYDLREGADRSGWLWQFWTRRDREELRANGERLIEHYRRLAVAAHRYPDSSDRRAAMLVRHGEPNNRATLRQAGIRPNESWRYRRPEGDLILHFVAADDGAPYRLVPSVFDLVAPEARGAPAGDDRADDIDRADRILRSRAQLSPFYESAVAGRRDQLAVFRQGERDQGRAGLALALGTDRYPLAFARDLPVRAQLAAFGGSADRGAVSVVVSIPAFALDSAAGGTVRVRVVAWDRFAVAVRALDTTISLGAAPGGEARGTVRLPVPDGRYSVRVAVESGSAGALVGRDGLAVEAAPAGPELSDLAVGLAAIAVGAGIRPLDSAAGFADPRARFGIADSIVVAARVYGESFAAGRYRLEYRPVRSDGKDEKWRPWPNRDRWQPIGPVSGGSAGVAARVGLARLKPGVYDLELVVLDGADHPIRGRTRITVESP